MGWVGGGGVVSRVSSETEKSFRENFAFFAKIFFRDHFASFLHFVAKILLQSVSRKNNAVAVQYTGHVIHMTTILHCYWPKFK